MPLAPRVHHKEIAAWPLTFARLGLHAGGAVLIWLTPLVTGLVAAGSPAPDWLWTLGWLGILLGDGCLARALWEGRWGRESGRPVWAETALDDVGPPSAQTPRMSGLLGEASPGHSGVGGDHAGPYSGTADRSGDPS